MFECRSRARCAERLRPVTRAGNKTFTYDLNGNMKSMATTTQTDDGSGGTTTSTVTRNLYWDDENRLLRTNEATALTTYSYDDKGNRVIKSGKYGEVVYVNSNYTVRNNTLISKHVFAGNTRVCSKVSDTEMVDGTSTRVDKGIYYYHGDHLGSSSVITDKTGGFYEHLEYFPYGETWIQEKAETAESLPYKFTSKEYDPETGLYYHGARYRDPRVGGWLSPDPALIEYLPTGNKNKDNNLPGMGGVFYPVNLNVYHYAANNPLKFIDPDGNDIILLNKSYGAAGNGHNGVLIGNDKYGWHYFSKDGPSGGSGGAHNHATYKTLADFRAANMNSEERLNDYDRGYRVETSVSQDIDMVNAGYEYIDRGYSFSEKNKNGEVKQNCADLAADIISAGGLKIEKPRGGSIEIEGTPIDAVENILGEITEPNTQFNNFMRDNKGESIKFRTEPPVKSLLPPKG